MLTVERGGWVVAWGEDVSAEQFRDGFVSPDVSHEEAEKFDPWMKSLVSRSLNSFGRGPRDLVTSEIRVETLDLASRGIRSGRNVFKQYEKIEIKAGAIGFSESRKASPVRPQPAIKPDRFVKVYVAYRLL